MNPLISDIQAATCAHFGIALGDLSARHAPTAHKHRPRQIAIYLAKRMTRRSLPDIGRRFGGRDHSTVMHTVARIEALMLSDDELGRDVAVIRAGLERRFLGATDGVSGD